MIWRLKNLFLRLKKITGSGRIYFEQHSSAKISINGYFVFGATTLGNMSYSKDESRLILDDSSHLDVDHVTVGRGSRLKLAKNATAKIGYNTYFSDNCFIAVSTQLEIGRDCAISWETQILDDDGHQIEDRMTKKPIIIGDRVWIGSRTVILKGARIGSGCVVASGSVVAGQFPENCLIGGVPARVIKENIHWK